MIVQKHILNSINSFYIETIKELYYNEEFMDYSMEKLISTYEIYGKKVDFYLSFIKNNGSFDYKIGAFYFPKQVNKKYKILSEPASVMAVTDSYRNENDSARRFSTNCIILDPTCNVKITVNALWDRYRDWVKEQSDDSLKLLTRADFDKQIVEIMEVKMKTPMKGGGWKGLVFKAANQTQPESDDEIKGNSLDL